MSKTILWFRQDLRLDDNPALVAAMRDGAVIPIYILDDDNADAWAMGGASRVWLHHALDDLNQQLNGQLKVYKGRAETVLSALKPDAVYWNRCYEPWRMQRDEELKKTLKSRGVHVESFNGSLLWEPWEIFKKDGTPYRVFSPFYRKGCLMAPPPRVPVAKPDRLVLEEGYHDPKSCSLDELNLLDARPWTRQICQNWDISEQGARAALERFLELGLENYKIGRDFPATQFVSRLSPYLHFGQISPHRIWAEVMKMNVALGHDDKNRQHFCSELGWREFSYSLLYFNQDLPKINLQSRFDAMPWRHDDEAFERWTKGQTGIPIVDAGMRELWQTGYMHNRVRMIVGSFLVKNLLIDWRLGQNWFWDCLFDADLANNSASWQWIAGCGADAAPYFRVFNPVLQSQKFDPEGEYIRRYVPELAPLPTKILHTPWEAPLTARSYPKSLVSLKETRERALAAFKNLS